VEAAEAPPFFDPNAVVVNLTEDDLNLALEDLWSALGARFSGTREQVSSTARGLHYDGRLSTPVIDLMPDGRASVRLALEEATVRLDSVEHTLLGRRVRCEDIGADLQPDRVLDLELRLDFRLEREDLRIVPTAVDVADPDGAFRLIKPSRCRRNLIPTFMLWWIAKPFLQKQFREIDQKLLASAERGAAQLEDDDGTILRKRVDVEGHELVIYPRRLTTDGDALWIVAAGASDESHPGTTSAEPPRALGRSSARSFLAVSEPTLNAILDRAYLEWSRPTDRPSGSLRKLFQSDELLTLVPGLREVENRERLHWGIRFTSPPRVRLETLRDIDARNGDAFSLYAWSPIADQPVITLISSGIEVEIARDDAPGEPLGVLSIDSGVVSAIPYANRLGGLSLQVVRNEWEVSSRGIRFEQRLLAATLQELIFAELFETRYEPLARGALTVGPIRFEPTGFAVAEGYLIIDLKRVAPPPQAATRTDSPRASR
ncbi:MAG TPA: hypothetical protein VD788_16415, partial [Candidatus Polarisedimenticolaceae bacterium]|nr:hypothetical protein [Candidatus Polarisedimenticolaceae bacterium]